MANEMFTTRSGKQIAVPSLVIPAHEVTYLMSLREEYEARGQYLSLLGVLLDVLDKGRRQVKNQWKNGDLSKNRRDFAKAIAVYMRDPVANAAAIQTEARRFGILAQSPASSADPVETEPEPELTEEQLDAATAPHGVA